ncbi:hypothetical protein U1839_01515 [Sphingomonas sp. RT2P30]|uniref:hypothetical protein n=1 Tax=Parasphingomonas halimpatiens TaxID=3096162 RepID=UPI002FC6925E
MRSRPLVLLVVAIAAALAIGWWGWQTGRIGAPTRVARDNPSSDERAARLMPRIDKHFVADNRHGQPRGPDGVTFYEQPTLVGGSLCRIGTYTLAAHVVANTPDNDVKVGERFGIWKRPTSPDQPAPAGQKACAAYRDFDHMIRADSPSAAMRGADLLDAMIARAQSGRLDVPHSCQDTTQAKRPDDSAPCDAIALLKRMTVKQLGDVASHSRKDAQGSSIFDDELTLWTGQDRGRQFVILRIVAEQRDDRPSSNGAKVVSLHASIGAID